jgi:hypothetical protein
MTFATLGSARRRILGACLVVAGLAAGGCSGEGARPTSSTGAPPRTGLAALEATYRCRNFGGELVGRWKPATRALACDVDGTTVHVYDRAPVPADAPQSLGPSVSGSVDHIDQQLRAGMQTPGCNVVLSITGGFFVVAPSDFPMEKLSGALGRPIRPDVPASPTISYLPPDCTLFS